MILLDSNIIDTRIAAFALIISILSFILSAIALMQNNRINITNLQAEYFKEIFEKYIVDKIPSSASKLEFENGKLSKSYRKLNDVIMDMLADAKYYAYAKREFYLELKSMAQCLEDKLISMSGRQVNNTDEQAKFIYDIHCDIMKMIKYINENYHKF